MVPHAAQRRGILGGRARAAAEALNRAVVADCTEARVRHPVGQALRNLSYICRHRGHHTQAVDLHARRDRPATGTSTTHGS